MFLFDMTVSIFTTSGIFEACFHILSHRINHSISKNTTPCKALKSTSGFQQQLPIIEKNVNFSSGKGNIFRRILRFRGTDVLKLIRLMFIWRPPGYSQNFFDVFLSVFRILVQ
ncbi:hypothetical protein I7I50_09666 [Histoplasma capsulatum G186AR]|uniref:Uncharacterized protein n=1 Tax=Ajellomyces capsulatus TaxID=5037 RepID=A0A8H7YUF8_AJECA|nr:hypothetical protein I7I52_07196 [Histoplasma capsulatum]QSS74466.1 hypothetical protein I7I50_09666 [Histoplasma capsulatum G186AR]